MQIQGFRTAARILNYFFPKKGDLKSLRGKLA